MRAGYDPGLNANVTWDDAGRIRSIVYFDQYREMVNLTGRAAAEAYIRDIAEQLKLTPEAVRSIEQPVSYLDPRQQGIEYRFGEEKTSFNTSTYVYYQTCLNTPVWSAGITVTIKHAPTGVQAPARIMAATDTSEQGIDAKLPSPETLERYRRLFATGERIDDPPHPPDVAGSDLLTEILGDAARVAMGLDDTQTTARLIHGRFYIYRYQATERRTKDQSPTLPLRAVPKSIQEGSWYLAAELVFRLPYGRTQKNWRILVDVETNTILSIRGMSSGIKGNVFVHDPMTRGFGLTAKRLNPVLNRRRQLEELRNLNPPNGGTQSLEGRFAKVVNITSPNFQPPTRPAGSDFDDFDVRTNEFAAVNAYYHVDRFFQLVEDLGFEVIGDNSYFKKTRFPVEVDHRAFRAPWPDGNVVNAALEGNGNGIDAVYFALADFRGGFVSRVTVTNGGSGYTSATTVKLTGGGGWGATAKIKPEQIVNGAVTAVTVDNPGKEYEVGALMEFSDEGGGTGACATPEIDVEKPIGIATDWRVTLHELGGHGTLWCHVEDDQFKFAHSAGDSFAMILTDYLSAWHDDCRNTGSAEFELPDRYLLLPFEPQVIARRSDRGVTEQSVARVKITDPGRDYLMVSLEDPASGVIEAKAVTEVGGGQVTQVTVTHQGMGHTDPPLVSLNGGGGSGATATAKIDSGFVTGVTVCNGGSGYDTPPIVNFIGGGPAKAGVMNSHIADGEITKVTVREAGMGYRDGQYKMTISGGGGTGAAATAQIVGGKLAAVTVTDGGSGYSRLIVELSRVGAGESAFATIDPENIVDGGRVTKVTVLDPGTGYPSVPEVIISGGGGTGAKGTAELGTWAWQGGMDQGTDGRVGGGYFSEQILSTTMFRAYQSIGGDATNINRREFAARYMAWLMLETIGKLSKASNPASPLAFLDALQTADGSDWTKEGLNGGAYGKVLAWAFEKQGLKDALRSGVDVYIEDGRAGGYEYVEVYWKTTAIWNRRSPDNLEGHQEPALGQTNFAYVKIKNRGTSAANDVIVKGYHCKPSAGLLWPDDLQAMTTPQLAAGTLQPNNAEEKTVGPFEWTPVTDGFSHDGLLMVVSATGDASNVNNVGPGESIEDWRLVPNDNNVAQRHVVLVPGGGGIQGLMAALHGKGLSVGNPGRSAAKIAVSVALPPLLAQRNWQIGHDLPVDGVQLNAREQRLITYSVQPGAPFTKADVEATTERDITLTTTANGAVIGGMTYRLDPAIGMPFNGPSTTP